MHRNDTIFSYIIYCTCLRLKERDALSYLKDKGFDISHAEYYRLKKEIENTTRERLNLVASTEFLAPTLGTYRNVKNDTE